jgi:hypothetical protein
VVLFGECFDRINVHVGKFAGNSCFCKFHENVDECACSLNSVDEFNNALVYPLLQQLLQRNYFRYYKVGGCSGAVALVLF